MNIYGNNKRDLLKALQELETLIQQRHVQVAEFALRLNRPMIEVPTAGAERQFYPGRIISCDLTAQLAITTKKRGK